MQTIRWLDNSFLRDGFYNRTFRVMSEKRWGVFSEFERFPPIERFVAVSATSLLEKLKTIGLEVSSYVLTKTSAHSGPSTWCLINYSHPHLARTLFSFVIVLWLPISEKKQKGHQQVLQSVMKNKNRCKNQINQRRRREKAKYIAYLPNKPLKDSRSICVRFADRVMKVLYNAR